MLHLYCVNFSCHICIVLVLAVTYNYLYDNNNNDMIETARLRWVWATAEWHRLCRTRTVADSSRAYLLTVTSFSRVLMSIIGFMANGWVRTIFWGVACPHLGLLNRSMTHFSRLSRRNLLHDRGNQWPASIWKVIKYHNHTYDNKPHQLCFDSFQCFISSNVPTVLNMVTTLFTCFFKIITLLKLTRYIC